MRLVFDTNVLISAFLATNLIPADPIQTISVVNPRTFWDEIVN